MTSNQKFYIGQKFYYAKSYDFVGEFTITEIPRIYLAEEYQQKKEFWKVVNTIYTIEDSEKKYKVFVDLDSKITIAEYHYYQNGRDEDYYYVACYPSNYLICEQEGLADMIKTLANKEINQQKKMIEGYQAKIQECWKVISKCNSVS